MHRLRSLRSLLQSLALASAPLAGACDLGTGECSTDPGREDRLVDLSQVPSEQQDLVADCRDESECEALCRWIIEDLALAPADLPLYACELSDDQPERLYLEYDNGIVCGRRPAGYQTSDVAADSAPARWFTTAARLEAASVDAFEHLARELSAHGAPTSLRRRAERAARDERRHTKLMNALARRYGGETATPAPVSRPVRPLLDVAIENAVEGCVRESYGTAVAFHQARAAASPKVRAALALVADDEASHAALAWDIERWYTAQATRKERETVAAARARAVDELRREIEVEPEAEAIAEVGLPPRALARSMVERAATLLWSGRAPTA